MANKGDFRDRPAQGLDCELQTPPKAMPPQSWAEVWGVSLRCEFVASSSCWVRGGEGDQTTAGGREAGTGHTGQPFEGGCCALSLVRIRERQGAEAPPTLGCGRPGLFRVPAPLLSGCGHEVVSPSLSFLD